MSERWLPVVGYEGLYEVSDLGRLRSVDRIDSAGCRLRGKTRTMKPDPSGYQIAVLAKDGVKRSFRFHRLVLETFVGPCPPGMEGCHGPNGSTDNRLSELRWDTRKSNVADKFAAGTQPSGTKIWKSKLTDRAVRKMRVLARRGVPRKEIARQFFTSSGNVSKVVTRKAWRHVA
jgi:hypothetical protein